MAKKAKLDFDPGIDPDALEDEWLKQPKLYFTWAKRLADARLDAEVAKQQLELTSAEVELYIRKHPASRGLGDKATDKGVAAAVAKDPEYIAAHTAYLHAQHAVGILAAAVAALDHRKRALENLVELNVREFFSEPRAKNPKAREVMETAGRRRIHGVRPRPEDDD